MTSVRKGRGLLPVSILVIAAGALCLNYTKGFDLEHHREWALEQGVPAPSDAIFFVGVLLSVLGGVLLGLALARRGERAQA